MNRNDEAKIRLEKASLRKKLKEIRGLISLDKQQKVALSAYQTLIPLLSPYPYILSYASFASELDLFLLNRQLALEQRLVLPKVENNFLALFKIERNDQLAKNSWGILEPIPSLCEPFNEMAISLVLVPGLGFDVTTNHRLGYGKGYYDRLLNRLPQNTPKWGIGFKERNIDHLPFNERDVRLDRVFLF